MKAYLPWTSERLYKSSWVDGQEKLREAQVEIERLNRKGGLVLITEQAIKDSSNEFVRKALLAAQDEIRELRTREPVDKETELCGRVRRLEAEVVELIVKENQRSSKKRRRWLRW